MSKEPKCLVTMDDNMLNYNDFVTVGYDGQDFQIAHNCDLMTLAVASHMIADAYQKGYKELPVARREEFDAVVKELLNGQNNS